MGVRQGDMPVTTMGGFSRFGGGGGNKIKTVIKGGGSWDGKRGDDPHGVTGGYGSSGGYSSRDQQRFPWAN